MNSLFFSKTVILYLAEGFTKCVIKAKYNRLYVVRHRLKNHKYAAKFIRPKYSPETT